MSATTVLTSPGRHMPTPFVSRPMSFTSQLTTSEAPTAKPSMSVKAMLSGSLSNLGWLQEMYESPAGLTVPKPPTPAPATPRASPFTAATALGGRASRAAFPNPAQLLHYERNDNDNDGSDSNDDGDIDMTDCNSPLGQQGRGSSAAPLDAVGHHVGSTLPKHPVMPEHDHVAEVAAELTDPVIDVDCDEATNVDPLELRSLAVSPEPLSTSAEWSTAFGAVASNSSPPPHSPATAELAPPQHATNAASSRKTRQRSPGSARQPQPTAAPGIRTDGAIAAVKAAAAAFHAAPLRPPATTVPVASAASAAAMHSAKPEPGTREYHASIVDVRPPYSYTALIYMAMQSIGKARVQLGEIYANIMDSWAYYKARPHETGWKNSIRHNLTVSRCFQKVARAEGEAGKGGYWEVDEKLAKIDIVLTPRDSSPKMSRKKDGKKKKKPTPLKAQAKGASKPFAGSRLMNKTAERQAQQDDTGLLHEVEEQQPPQLVLAPPKQQLPAHLLGGMFDVEMSAPGHDYTTECPPVKATKGHSSMVLLPPERDDGFGAMAGSSFSGSFSNMLNFASSLSNGFGSAFD